MRANRKCRRKDLSRRKIPRFNLKLNAPSGFPLKIASIKTEAVLGKRGNAGFSEKSRAASVEIESTINPTGLRSGAGCQKITVRSAGNGDGGEERNPRITAAS
jgi:hypothetical protein